MLTFVPMKHAIQLFLLLGFLLLAMPAQAQSRSEGTPPSSYVLSAAYPNPFNPRTSFNLTVQDRQEVRVEIYNLLGQPVKRLFQGVMEAGETRTFHFEAGELPSGIYLYRVQGQRFTATRQVTLLK